MVLVDDSVDKWGTDLLENIPEYFAHAQRADRYDLSMQSIDAFAPGSHAHSICYAEQYWLRDTLALRYVTYAVYKYGTVKGQSS